MPSFDHEYYEGVLFGDDQTLWQGSISSIFSKKIKDKLGEDYEEVEVNKFFDPVQDSLGLNPVSFS